MSVHKMDYKTRDGRCWKFRTYYIDVEGKRKSYKSGNYATKKEAEQAEKEYLKNVKNLYKNLPPKITTMGELREAFINQRKNEVRKSTVDGYKDKSRFCESINDIKIKDFDFQMFDKWKNEINCKDYKVGYKNDIYKFLKSVMNYGVKYHDIDFTKTLNKMNKFKDPNAQKEEKQIWTIEEFNKFIEVVDDEMLKVMYKVYFYCGLRKGEGRALTWKDIDFNNGKIRINKSINGSNVMGPPKTESSYRNVPIRKQLLKELERLKDSYSWDNDYCEDNYVFGGKEPVSRYYLENNLEKYYELADVKKITMHGFRHSCASMLISLGMNVAVVSKYLGHAKITQTLDTYTHTSEQDNINLRNTLDTI